VKARSLPPSSRQARKRSGLNIACAHAMLVRFRRSPSNSHGRAVDLALVPSATHATVTEVGDASAQRPATERSTPWQGPSGVGRFERDLDLSDAGTRVYRFERRALHRIVAHKFGVALKFEPRTSSSRQHPGLKLLSPCPSSTFQNPNTYAEVAETLTSAGATKPTQTHHRLPPPSSEFHIPSSWTSRILRVA